MDELIPDAYVGKGDQVWQRCYSHIKDYPFAENVIIVVGEGITETHIECIENMIYLEGCKVNNYSFRSNKSVPHKPSNMTELETDFCENFYEDFKSIIDATTLNVFSEHIERIRLKDDKKDVLKVIIPEVNSVKISIPELPKNVEEIKNLIEKLKEKDQRCNDTKINSNSRAMTDGDTHTYYMFKETQQGYWKDSMYKPDRGTYTSYNALKLYENGVKLYEMIALRELYSAIEVQKTNTDGFGEKLIEEINNGNIKKLFGVDYNQTPNDMEPSRGNKEFRLRLKNTYIKNYEEFGKYSKFHIDMSNINRKIVEYIMTKLSK